MTKLIAILNVVAWSGFWAFGYIALTSDVSDATRMTTAAILAFVGAVMGVFAYLWLVRHTEATGYAAAPRRAFPKDDEIEEIA
jgi:hypothetical protein